MKGQSVLKTIQLVFAIACICVYRYGPRLSILGVSGDAVQPIRLDEQKLENLRQLSVSHPDTSANIAYQGLQMHLTQADAQMFATITYGTFLVYTSVLLLCYLLGNGLQLRTTYMEIIFDLLGAVMYITTGSLIGEFYSSSYSDLFAKYELPTGGDPTGLAIISVITGSLFLIDFIWVLFDRRTLQKEQRR